MARYMSLHTVACLTRQGAEELSRRLAAAQGFAVPRVAVNLTEGKMVVEYEADDRKLIEKWLARERFHHEWLLRLELEWRDGKLEPA